MKLPYTEFANFHLLWYAGAYEPQRYGQAFMNKYTKDITDPDLFYERDANKCFSMIMDKYVTHYEPHEYTPFLRKSLDGKTTLESCKECGQSESDPAHK